MGDRKGARVGESFAEAQLEGTPEEFAQRAPWWLSKYLGSIGEETATLKGKSIVYAMHYLRRREWESANLPHVDDEYHPPGRRRQRGRRRGKAR